MCIMANHSLPDGASASVLGENDVPVDPHSHSSLTSSSSFLWPLDIFHGFWKTKS
jgi:hypothetical protein